MWKLAVAVLAVALVGSADAEGWRLDAGSHRAFKRSLEAAKDELSPENVKMLGGALKHIWEEGTKAAEAEHRSYSRKDYFRQLDGLSYEEVVHFTDATYDAALNYNSASGDAIAFALAAPRNERTHCGARCRAPDQPYRETGTFNRSFRNENEPRGGTDLVGVPGQQ